MFVLEPITIDERTLAKRHIDALTKNMTDGKDLIICDRGYPSKDLIDYCESNNIKYLMRVRKKFNVAVDAVQGDEGFVKIRKTYCTSGQSDFGHWRSRGFTRPVRQLANASAIV